MAIFAEARMSMMSTKLLKSKSIRSIAVVAAGSAGAQLINVAFTPLITRLYGPEAFGVLGTFLAVLAVITPVASLSYPIGIVLPKQHQEAMRLAVSSIVIAVITSLITALALWLFKAPIVALFNLQAIEPYLYLLPLSMCFAALVAIASNWILRRKLFNVSARIAVMQSFLANSAKVGLGLINPVAAMLVVISTVATLVYSIMLWVGIRRRPAPAEPPSTEPSASALELLRRHSDFPLYRTPQIVVNSISQSLPVLMIASLFGPVAAGLYALPKTVLGVPSILIGKSVASVFYPQFVDMVREGQNVRRLLVKSCGSLLLIAVAVYTPVVLFGPWLFSLVFGTQWHASGDYARWMSLWFIATLITRPIVAAIPVLALQGMFLIYEVVSLVLRALAIYVGYYMTQSALGAVAAFSLMNVFAYGVLTYYVIRKAPSV